MKVLLVSSGSGSRGGGEFFLCYLAMGLSRKGYEVELWCPNHTRMDEFVLSFPEGVTVHRGPYLNSYLDRKFRNLGAACDSSAVENMTQKFGELAPDVIHLNLQTPEDASDLIRAARRTKISSLATVHITQTNKELGGKQALLRDWFAKRSLRRADMPLVAVSDLRAEGLRKIVGERGQVERVYNGVGVRSESQELSRKEIFTKLGWSEKHSLVVMVGRLEEQKDPFLFLQSAAKISQVWPEARFLWIGDGSLRSMFESEAVSLGLEEKVKCWGWVEDPEPFLKLAALYFHSARFEGLPLSILEAMSFGLPCVIPSSVAREARVFSEKSVWLCDEEIWLQEIVKEENRKQKGKAARALFEEYFTCEAMAAGYSKLYQKLG